MTKSPIFWWNMAACGTASSSPGPGTAYKLNAVTILGRPDMNASLHVEKPKAPERREKGFSCSLWEFWGTPGRKPEFPIGIKCWNVLLSLRLHLEQYVSKPSRKLGTKTLTWYFWAMSHRIVAIKQYPVSAVPGVLLSMGTAPNYFQIGW